MAATELQKETYEEIMTLYDLAEEVIDVVEFGNVQQREEYVPHVEKFIGKIEVAVEELAQSYIIFVESGKKPTRAEAQKIDEAFTKIFAAVENFRNGSRTLN